MNVKKSHLLDVLKTYDDNKGIRRRLFGDTDGVRDLRRFVETQLSTKNPNDFLTDAHQAVLKELLKKQFYRIRTSSDNYRSKPQKLTNKVYTQLGQTLAKDDPEIFYYIQYYANDLTLKNQLVVECGKTIFFTSRRYALPLDELVESMLLTESFSHPDPEKKFNVPLSPEDIHELKQLSATLPLLKTAIAHIEQKFSYLKNSESLNLEPLNTFPKSALLMTQDGYGFVIDELMKTLIEKNRFYNPYTQVALHENDVDRLMFNDKVVRNYSVQNLVQRYYARKISPQTVHELKKLAERLLNNEVAPTRGFFNPVRIGLSPFEKFKNYYETLQPIEKNALDNYIMKSWDTIEIAQGMMLASATARLMSGIVWGMSAHHFSSLYRYCQEGTCSMDMRGAAIAQVVLQLNPEIQFDGIYTHSGSRVIEELVYRNINSHENRLQAY